MVPLGRSHGCDDADGAHAASARPHIIAAAETKGGCGSGMRGAASVSPYCVVSAVVPTLTLCTRNAPGAAASPRRAFATAVDSGLHPEVGGDDRCSTSTLADVGEGNAFVMRVKLGIDLWKLALSVARSHESHQGGGRRQIGAARLRVGYDADSGGA